MNRVLKFTPEFILLAFILLFFLFKHPGNNWERVINSDGKGYYAHLTSIFIYHDLSYAFIEHYEDRYYPPDRLVFKEFRVKTETGIVNKCFPGLAIAWLPFFLAVHGYCLAFGLIADGYSLPYQYAIAFAALFYLWLGCRLLFLLLQKLGSSRTEASFITLLIGLGTNIIFYTIIEGSMTHVYSFALITAFFYVGYSFFLSKRWRWFIAGCFLFGVIVLIRPVNGLILFLVPAMSSLARVSFPYFKMHPERSGDRIVFKSAMFGLGTLILLSLVSIPLLIWHAQTGNWIVYTYGEERFHFFNPHFFEILFSYNRGWFVYTPIAFLSLFGMIGMYKRDKTATLWIGLFLITFVYVASSWWMWYYASKCGQRVFVDILVIPAILLAFLFQEIRDSKITSALISLLLGGLLLLNLLQFYQHYRWIFPATEIDSHSYWRAFFSLHPKAIIEIPEGALVDRSEIRNDLEKPIGWMNEGTIIKMQQGKAGSVSLISSRSPYSIGYFTQLDSLFTTSNRVVKVSAWICPLGSRHGALGVCDLGQNGKGIYYKAFYVDPFVSAFRWTKIETAFYIPADISKVGEGKFYFYLPPGNDPMLIDDLHIEFISLKNEARYTKLDGILIPTK